MSRKIAWTAMLVALTVIGSATKVPAIIGSVALDAFPALLAADLLGGPAGAVVGGMGHLLSAMLGGMPLGALHGVISVEMALLAIFFGSLYRSRKKWSASILFILGNSFAAPLPFLFILGEAFYLAMVPSLFAGSMLAAVIIPKLAPWTKEKAKEKVHL